MLHAIVPVLYINVIERMQRYGCQCASFRIAHLGSAAYLDLN